MTRRTTTEAGEEVKVTKEEGVLGGYRYEHPSYGMISVSRTQGETGLFGTDINHNGFMKLTISEADVRQDLGRNWYHDTKVITEINMSSVQYAEMISSPNTQGVPCTIRYRQDLGSIRYKAPMDAINNIQEEVDNSFKRAKDKPAQVFKEVEEIFKKQSIGKADKQKILAMISNLGGEIAGSVPFYQKSAQEILERRVMEAKSEVDSYICHVQTTIGKHVMDNPEVLRLITKENDDG